jgi:hypothetical protein
MPGAKALGKRRATESDLIELDKDREVPLPENRCLQECSTQRRSSGRVPNRLRG